MWLLHVLHNDSSVFYKVFQCIAWFFTRFRNGFEKASDKLMVLQRF